ncbi:hypothetical protein DFJ74DRAFT_490975 [Hyaloraphidium curvatum]|nr:hypothetical protein DFJ74DRAFT_490975 [Hyaloraphidium curvatum]
MLPWRRRSSQDRRMTAGAGPRQRGRVRARRPARGPRRSFRGCRAEAGGGKAEKRQGGRKAAARPTIRAGRGARRLFEAQIGSTFRGGGPTAPAADLECFRRGRGRRRLVRLEETHQFRDAAMVAHQRPVQGCSVWSSFVLRVTEAVSRNPQFFDSRARIAAASPRCSGKSELSRSTSGFTPSRCAMALRIWAGCRERHGDWAASSFSDASTQPSSLVLRMLTKSRAPSAATNACACFSVHLSAASRAGRSNPTVPASLLDDRPNLAKCDQRRRRVARAGEAEQPGQAPGVRGILGRRSRGPGEIVVELLGGIRCMLQRSHCLS